LPSQGEAPCRRHWLTAEPGARNRPRARGIVLPNPSDYTQFVDEDKTLCGPGGSGHKFPTDGWELELARLKVELSTFIEGFISRHSARCVMDDPDRYKKYAAECKRMAQTMSLADRKVMLEIAEAWLTCAKSAEAKNQKQDT
jgi:hypothetical protein